MKRLIKKEVLILRYLNLIEKFKNNDIEFIVFNNNLLYNIKRFKIKET